MRTDSKTKRSTDPKASPASRPLQRLSDAALRIEFERACANGDSLTGAHCIHELWMRGAMPLAVERDLARLWAGAPASIPDWLPMRYVDRLPEIYEIALRFTRRESGRSNIYLVLLDYSDSRDEPQGLYVGMSKYSPAQRFDQHKAGIRSAGSVLRRGLEVLTGPTRHLQYLRRAEAEFVEERFAEALTTAGFFVQGGH